MRYLSYMKSKWYSEYWWFSDLDSEMDIQIHTLESLQSDGDEQSGLYACLCVLHICCCFCLISRRWSCCSESVFPIRWSAAALQLNRPVAGYVNWLWTLCLTLAVKAGETFWWSQMISFLSPALCSKTDWYYTFTSEMSSPTEVKRA